MRRAVVTGQPAARSGRNQGKAARAGAGDLLCPELVWARCRRSGSTWLRDLGSRDVQAWATLGLVARQRKRADEMAVRPLSLPRSRSPEVALGVLRVLGVVGLAEVAFGVVGAVINSDVGVSFCSVMACRPFRSRCSVCPAVVSIQVREVSVSHLVDYGCRQLADTSVPANRP
jgi:hypothetical protein